MLVYIIVYLSGLATIPSFFLGLLLPDLIRDGKYQKRYAKVYYATTADWNKSWTPFEQTWFLQYHPKGFIQLSDEDHYFRIRFDELENMRRRRVEASYWPWLAEFIYE
jgi:hypothetical protein